MNGGWDQATWKRVESGSELRVGLTVRLLRCTCCATDHHMVLLEGRQPSACTLHGASYCWWRHTPTCRGDLMDRGCLFVAISEWRLYSLVDTTPAEEATTTTRELEKVTG